MLQLRLYVAGNAPNSLLAVANARALCEQHYHARHELEIVDMLTEPMRAYADGVVVTPTLLKLGPSPSRRLVGTLADLAQVLLVLEAT